MYRLLYIPGGAGFLSSTVAIGGFGEVSGYQGPRAYGKSSHSEDGGDQIER